MCKIELRFSSRRIGSFPLNVLLGAVLGSAVGLLPLTSAAELLQVAVAEGYCWIGILTQPGATYQLQCSTNLHAWDTLAANIPGTGGAYQILDPETPSALRPGASTARCNLPDPAPANRPAIQIPPHGRGLRRALSRSVAGLAR